MENHGLDYAWTRPQEIQARGSATSPCSCALLQAMGFKGSGSNPGY
ncbi:MAG TPA: hypothetical protein VL053_10970 [Arachidicoccus sp.]|nr:hypothetical protein [Arachidicoccus sp.]